MDELFEHTKAIYMNDARQPEHFTKPIAVQRHSPDRRLHGGRLDQGGVEDGGRDQEDPGPRDRRAPPPACACRSSSAMPRRSTSSSRARSAPTRRASACARRQGVRGRRRREAGEYVTPTSASASTACSSRASAGPDRAPRAQPLVVSDNLRKGAALNAVQIAEAMVARGPDPGQAGGLMDGGAPGPIGTRDALIEVAYAVGALVRCRADAGGESVDSPRSPRGGGRPCTDPARPPTPPWLTRRELPTRASRRSSKCSRPSVKRRP